MAKLNQIIAIEKGIKSHTYSHLTEANKAIQKGELFVGFDKTYRSVDEDGEQLPTERKHVTFTVQKILKSTSQTMTELYDVTARKDWTNCHAKADVLIDGKPILKGVPVTYLLFLEKQLTDMRTFVGNLPVLDPTEVWSPDPNSGLFRTDATETHRTKKIQKPIVLYPATEQHPAQTQMITEDILAGFWKQVKHSGAMPKPDKESLQERVEKLLQAVKQAREAANSCDESSETPKMGDTLFGYLFG